MSNKLIIKFCILLLNGSKKDIKYFVVLAVACLSSGRPDVRSSHLAHHHSSYIVVAAVEIRGDKWWVEEKTIYFHFIRKIKHKKFLVVTFKLFIISYNYN